jgi:plasmid maintenance system antidote protein VapI
MTYGTKSKLAKSANIKPQVFSDYMAGRSGASAPVADRLAALTGTDIRVWLQGGSVEARRAAVEAWAESNVA